MVARRADVMLVFPVAAKGLLVIYFAGSVINSFAGEQQNEENGDNNKRHKIRGFLSFYQKNLRENAPGSRSDYITFQNERKACN